MSPPGYTVAPVLVTATVLKVVALHITQVVDLHTTQVVALHITHGVALHITHVYGRDHTCVRQGPYITHAYGRDHAGLSMAGSGVEASTSAHVVLIFADFRSLQGPPACYIVIYVITNFRSLPCVSGFVRENCCAACS